jgi:hypothetical protein
MLGRWLAKMVTRLLATAALWVQIQTSLKITKWEYKHRSGKHTLARQKSMQKVLGMAWSRAAVMKILYLKKNLPPS